jgi:hypothetical protein
MLRPAGVADVGPVGLAIGFGSASAAAAAVEVARPISHIETSVTFVIVIVIFIVVVSPSVTSFDLFVDLLCIYIRRLRSHELCLSIICW